jgi:hypothetical protein
MKTTCSVVVLYEDPPVREIAVDFCDHLVRRFWDKCGFEVSWWSFAQLRELAAAREATRRAKAADLIVVAVQQDPDIDPLAQAWLETGLKQRGEREGALVGLTSAAAEPNERALQKHMYLRNLAHRSGLDYLTCVPSDVGSGALDSCETCTERAGQVTTVLTEILRQRETPHFQL